MIDAMARALFFWRRPSRAFGSRRVTATVLRKNNSRTQPMLVLTRKAGQQIRIGRSIVLTVVDVRPGRTRLGIEAPAEVAVWREELCSTNLPARETAEQRPPSRKPAGSLSKALRARR